MVGIFFKSKNLCSLKGNLSILGLALQNSETTVRFYQKHMKFGFYEELGTLEKLASLVVFLSMNTYKHCGV